MPNHISYTDVYYIHEPSFPNPASIQKMRDALQRIEDTDLGQAMFAGILEQRKNNGVPNNRENLQKQFTELLPIIPEIQRSAVQAQIDAYENIPESEKLRSDKLSLVYGTDPIPVYKQGYDYIIVNPDYKNLNIFKDRSGNDVLAPQPLDESIVHESTHSLKQGNIPANDTVARACEEARATDQENAYRASKDIFLFKNGYQDPEAFLRFNQQQIKLDSSLRIMSLAMTIRNMYALNYACTEQDSDVRTQKSQAMLDRVLPQIDWAEVYDTLDTPGGLSSAPSSFAKSRKVPALN